MGEILEDNMPTQKGGFMKRVVDDVLDYATKLAILAALVLGGLWLRTDAVNKKAAIILQNQTNAVNQVVERLKRLENEEVDKILGVNR